MNMELKDGSFFVNNKPIYIYSGEIHYWRIQKNEWEKHLKKAKQAGLNTISTYVPWCIHEPEDGKINLTEFVNFIEEAKKHNLYLIARIGPISNAELVLEGLPKWLPEKHPEIYIKGKDLLTLPHTTIVSYHNPTFLSYVKRWYDNILPIISKNQITLDGNIILLQLCNEIGMVHWLHKAVDYSDTTQKMYREFLKSKYQKIDNLNLAYNTKYTDFNEIKLPDNNVEDITQWNIKLDLIYFCADYYAKYFNILYNETQKHKISIGIVANIPQFYDYDVRGRGIFSPMTTIMFRDFTKYAPTTIFGGAYQPRQVDYENFHDIHITSEVVKMITKKDIPSICCELQTGILKDRPKLYPQDVELNLKTSAASGLNGLNAYMFSGGKNENNTGAFGSYHEWQAPVSSDGKERNHFTPMKLFGKFINCFGEKLEQTKKVCDTTIGFYAPYYATELLKGKFVDDLELKRNLFFYDGVARILQIAGYNFDLMDIEKCSLEEIKQKPHLWIFSLDFMDEKTQNKILDYVKIGGKIIIGPSIDKKFASKIGLKTEFVKENFVYINGKDYYIMDKIQTYEGNVDNVLVTTSQNKPCAIKNKIGAGEAIIYGFGITHFYDYIIEIVKNWSEEIGIEQKIKTSNNSICSTLRANNEEGFLFVFNYHLTEEETNIEVLLPSRKKIKLSGVKLAPRSSQVLPLNIKIDSEKILNHSNTEILEYKLDKQKTSFIWNSLTDNCVEMGLFCDKKPKQVKHNDKKIKFNFSKKGLTIYTVATKGPQEVTIFW